MRIVFVDLVAPGHLEIADLDRVTVLDATLPELIQDAGPVEDTLEAVRRLPLVEVRHLREPLDTHARNDVAILFDLLDFPRPLVDVADRVDASLRPGLLKLLLFRFMEADLAHHVADPVVERLDALTGRGGDLVQLVSLAAEDLLQARQVVPRFLQVDLVEDNQHGLVTHAGSNSNSSPLIVRNSSRGSRPSRPPEASRTWSSSFVRRTCRRNS